MGGGDFQGLEFLRMLREKLTGPGRDFLTRRGNPGPPCQRYKARDHNRQNKTQSTHRQAPLV
jgi:hypothetical protein